MRSSQGFGTIRYCIAARCPPLKMPMMRKFQSKSPLDDPQNAAYAWARYRRIMRFMFWITVGVVVLALAALYNQNGMVSVHYFIATALGIGFSMLLASALMGLIFLSNGTGHDSSVDNELPDNDPDKPDST